MGNKKYKRLKKVMANRLILFLLIVLIGNLIPDGIVKNVLIAAAMISFMIFLWAMGDVIQAWRDLMYEKYGE